MALKLKAIERIKSLARLGVFTSCVFVGFAALATRSVYGNAGEASLIMGREFADLNGAVSNGQRVRLNGEEIYVGSTTVDMATDEVLDRFEALCRKDAQGLEEAVKDPALGLSREKKAALEGMGVEGLGILRSGSRGEGTVACLVRPVGATAGFRAFAERLAGFSQNLDLKELGRLRYVYTRPTSDKKRTQVITVWSEGSLRLNRVFVSGTEAPGSDPVGVPRPPESTRLLSAEVDGAPYGVHLYESARPAAEVLSFYDEQLVREGWSPISEVTRQAPEARAFSRGGSELMLFAESGPQKTAISLVEMPSKAQ